MTKIYKMKKALITGIAGQDGSYLAEVFVNQKLSSSWYS